MGILPPTTQLEPSATDTHRLLVQDLEELKELQVWLLTPTNTVSQQKHDNVCELQLHPTLTFRA